MAQERKTARYRVQGTVQSGSLFTVTKAIDEQDQVPVLVRRFAAHLFADDNGWQQFRKGLQEFSQIALAGLLPVRQIGGSTRQPWIVIGPTEGATLRERWSSKLPARPLDELEPLANTLTELHALGHVHGRVQSDAIFFDPSKRPCLDELASVYALCGWEASRHELHADYIGELMAADYLAPEIRSGGIVTPQTDQYSLAVLLLECLTGQPRHSIDLTASPKARRGLIEPLQPVLARALSEDPQQRFPTCREFFVSARQAQQGQRRRQLRRFAVAASALVLLVAMIAGKWAWDRSSAAQEKARVEKEKQRLRQEIVGEYEINTADLKVIHDLPVSKNLLALRSEPDGKTVVDDLLKKYSAASGTTPKPKTLSEQFPSVSLTLSSASAPRTGNRADGSSSSYFAFTETAYLVRLDDPSGINWNVDAKWPYLIRQEGNLRAEIVDGNNQVLAKQTEKIPNSSNNIFLSGTISSRTLKLGDSFRARLWVQENGPKEIEWSKSTQTYRVGIVDSQVKSLKLSPSSVQAGGYEVDSGVEVRPGDHLSIQVSGTITLGTETTRANFGIEKNQRITPAGLFLSSKAIQFGRAEKLTSVSPNTSHTWGAFLYRLERGSWEMASNPRSTSRTPQPQNEFEIKRQIQDHEAGRLFLSINSIKVKDKKNILPTVKTYWLGDDGFDVRITVQSAKFPAEASESVKARVRSSLGL